MLRGLVVVGERMFFACKALAGFEGLFPLGLGLTYVVYGALDGCIGAFENLAGLVLGFGYYHAALLSQVFGIVFVALQHLFDAFLLKAYLLTFVFPIPTVAGNVEKILVEVHIIAAYDFAGLGYDAFGQADFACNLYGKRAAGCPIASENSGCIF